MLWELYTGERLADECTSIGQVFYMIVHQGWRPPIPEDCPPGYVQLMTACWAEDPNQRPCANEVLNTLQELYMGVRQQRSHMDKQHRDQQQQRKREGQQEQQREGQEQGEKQQKEGLKEQQEQREKGQQQQKQEQREKRWQEKEDSKLSQVAMNTDGPLLESNLREQQEQREKCQQQEQHWQEGKLKGGPDGCAAAADEVREKDSSWSFISRAGGARRIQQRPPAAGGSIDPADELTPISEQDSSAGPIAAAGGFDSASVTISSPGGTETGYSAFAAYGQLPLTIWTHSRGPATAISDPLQQQYPGNVAAQPGASTGSTSPYLLPKATAC